MSITVIEVRSASAQSAGYGRDADEAFANAGWSEEPADIVVREVQVNDMPTASDTVSAEAARVVCGFHVDDDEEIPEAVRAQLRSLMETRMFAAAVLFCFDVIWDRSYELDLPPSERKYLP